MRLFQIVFAALVALAPLSARAEYVHGMLTWVAKDKLGIGMIHADPNNFNVRRWTTNGTVYTCNVEHVDPNNGKAIVYCPSIRYRIEMQRNQVLVANDGGVATYPGGWDDRRAFYYSSGDKFGNFTLKDNYVWVESQYKNGVLLASYTFKETWRDDYFIYMFDASRTVHIALTRNKASMLLQGDAAYRPLYDGSW